jgi:hypothetical protein
LIGIANNDTKKRKQTETTMDDAPTSFKGKDGTEWNVVDTQDDHAGRIRKQNVLMNKPGPTAFAERSVINDSPTSILSIY